MTYATLPRSPCRVLEFPLARSRKQRPPPEPNHSAESPLFRLTFTDRYGCEQHMTVSATSRLEHFLPETFPTNAYFRGIENFMVAMECELTRVTILSSLALDLGDCSKTYGYAAELNEHEAV